jgi:hypothetical protein
MKIYKLRFNESNTDLCACAGIGIGKEIEFTGRLYVRQDADVF